MSRMCRDCPAYFELTDVRRLLCDSCRLSHRRAIVARANRKLWASTPKPLRSGLYKKQWKRELARRGKLHPELQQAVIMVGNLRKRISEKQNRRSA